MFALKLKQSKFLPSAIDWDFLIANAAKVINRNAYLQREFLVLVQKAQKIYEVKKKKKKKSAKQTT